MPETTDAVETEVVDAVETEVVDAPVKSKREQVKDCIALGTLTKAEIAEQLGMSAASVATQMTYLRWMDNYIVTEAETKILSFTDKDTYEAMEAEAKANRKTKSTVTRTPAERAVAVAKTIKNQTAALAKWKAKVVECTEMVETTPEDADAALNLKEAIAQVALHEVKLARNEKLASELPAPEEAAAAPEVSDDDDAVVSDDDSVVSSDEETEELL